MPDAPASSLVVPVKRLDRAKTRLSPIAAARAELALAFALDTVEAASRCPRVRTLVVVTDDERVREGVLALGVEVLPDVPAAGLNPAIAYGVHRLAFRVPQASVGALAADLPALRPRELSRALDLAHEHRSAFVPDRSGTGTTLLVARHVRWFEPRFGDHSRARHRDAGAVEIGVDRIASVRSDVDTDDDLLVAERLGFGPRTTSAVAVHSRAARTARLSDPSGAAGAPSGPAGASRG